jgi:hypothetical protein
MTGVELGPRSRRRNAAACVRIHDASSSAQSASRPASFDHAISRKPSLGGAIEDVDEAIRPRRDFRYAIFQRGIAREGNSDLAGALDMERAREQPSLARWRYQGEENSRFLIDKMAPKFASLFSAWLQLR